VRIEKTQGKREDKMKHSQNDYRKDRHVIDEDCTWSILQYLIPSIVGGRAQSIREPEELPSGNQTRCGHSRISGGEGTEQCDGAVPYESSLETSGTPANTTSSYQIVFNVIMCVVSL
jgi:hypothetical protein